MRAYTYGPFPSRRLGLSLGVDILPRTKLCTYNCVYCEIGSTEKNQLVSPEHRIKMPPSPNFRNELKSILTYFPHLNSITNVIGILAGVLCLFFATRDFLIFLNLGFLNKKN